MQKIPELVCPAGNLPALKTAVDNGADTVYMGLKDATNARNFPGLNFDMKSAREGVAYAHARGRNVLMAINTFAQAGQVERWHAAVDTAADLGADAIIVADPAIMAYAADKTSILLEFPPAKIIPIVLLTITPHLPLPQNHRSLDSHLDSPSHLSHP